MSEVIMHGYSVTQENIPAIAAEIQDALGRLRQEMETLHGRRAFIQNVCVHPPEAQVKSNTSTFSATLCRRCGKEWAAPSVPVDYSDILADFAAEMTGDPDDAPDADLDLIEAELGQLDADLDIFDEGEFGVGLDDSDDLVGPFAIPSEGA